MTRYSFRDAQETILKIMARKDGGAQREGLRYFALFPRKEVSEYILPFYENKKWEWGRLPHYPILFAFAASPQITPEVRLKVQALVRKYNPLAEFDSPKAREPHAALNRGEMREIIKAIYDYKWNKLTGTLQGRNRTGFFLMLDGEDPSPDFIETFNGLPYPVHRGSEHARYGGAGFVTIFSTDNVQWVTSDQALVKVGFGSGEDMYLVVHKDQRSIATMGERLWIE